MGISFLEWMRMDVTFILLRWKAKLSIINVRQNGLSRPCHVGLRYIGAHGQTGGKFCAVS
jgi:hypothetical protein